MGILLCQNGEIRQDSPEGKYAELLTEDTLLPWLMSVFEFEKGYCLLSFFKMVGRYSSLLKVVHHMDMLGVASPYLRTYLSEGIPQSVHPDAIIGFGITQGLSISEGGHGYTTFDRSCELRNLWVTTLREALHVPFKLLHDEIQGDYSSNSGGIEILEIDCRASTTLMFIEFLQCVTHDLLLAQLTFE